LFSITHLLNESYDESNPSILFESSSTLSLTSLGLSLLELKTLSSEDDEFIEWNY